MDILLSWNQDQNNGDGFMAYFHWDGTKIESDCSTSKQGVTIEKAVLLDDQDPGNIDKLVLNDIPIAGMKNRIVD